MLTSPECVLCIFSYWTTLTNALKKEKKEEDSFCFLCKKEERDTEMIFTWAGCVCTRKNRSHEHNSTNRQDYMNKTQLWINP